VGVVLDSPQQTVGVLYSTSAAVQSTAVVEDSHSLFPSKKHRGRPFINTITCIWTIRITHRLPKGRASSRH